MSGKRHSQLEHIVALLLALVQACGSPHIPVSSRLAEAGDDGAGAESFPAPDGGGPVIITDIPYISIDREATVSITPIIINPAATEGGQRVSAGGELPARGEAWTMPAPSTIIIPHSPSSTPGSSESSGFGRSTSGSSGSGGFELPPSLPPPAPWSPSSSTPAGDAPSASQPPATSPVTPEPAPQYDPTTPWQPPPSSEQPSSSPSFTIVWPSSASDSNADNAAALAALSEVQAWYQAYDEAWTAFARANWLFVNDNKDTLSKGRAARQTYQPSLPNKLAPSDYPYKTPVESANGQRLAEAWEYKRTVEQALTDDLPRAEDRRQLVAVADAGLHEADEAFEQNEAQSAELSYTLAIMALDAAISLSPFSWAKDTFEAVTGNSLLTGEDLGTFGRGLAIVGVGMAAASVVVVGTQAIPAVLAIQGTVKLLKRAAIGTKAESAVEAAALTARGVFDSAKKYGFGKSGDEVSGFAKNLGPTIEPGFSNVLYPRGPGASLGSVPDGYKKVSRWMDEAEVKSWYDGGGTRLPAEVGANKRLYVTDAGAPKPGGTGNVRTDFYVPEGMLQKAGNDQWWQVIQPQSNAPIYNVKIFLP